MPTTKSIQIVDSHTGGEPTRVVIGGGPDLGPGSAADQLKVFRSLGNFLSEFRLYRRDKDGRVVKQRDHLMDAMRYLVMTGRDRTRAKPAPPKPEYVYNFSADNTQRWMM